MNIASINMPSKEEKRRRAVLVKAIVQEETTKAIGRMPISFKELSELFDYLDKQLEIEGCEHTAKMTKRFLESIKLNTEVILPWLEEYGGYCDCEILSNVEDFWEKIIKNTHNK